MTEKPHLIVGTAGHIDHGKSALVKALTGTDPDTLPEEKERGMTIELGFVFLDRPDYEKQIVFIDVPGHEKFVKTMVAGASNVDAVLFVIAADEGISVQTREHFDILRLLSVREGIVALTKSDLVDADRLDTLTEEVRVFVAGTFLENAPIMPVSAHTGAGLPALVEALQIAGLRVERRDDCGYFRMPIDRVFVKHGFGTVIAGTILSGEVKVGDKIEILPERIEARVRGVQVHKSKQEASGLGRRTAINIHDVEKEALRRGQCAARPGFLVPTQRLDARLRLLPNADIELKTRDRVRFHVGTDETIARVVLLEKEKLLPGESMLAQFVLEAPTTALYGDRFIIRTFSPLNTIGGGEVLDVTPVRHKRFDETALAGIRRFEGAFPDAVDQVFRKDSAKARSVEDISLTLGRTPAIVRAAIDGLVQADRLVRIKGEKDERFIPADAFAALKEKAYASIKKYLTANPHKPFMPAADLASTLARETGDAALRQALDALASAQAIVRLEGGVGLPGHQAKLVDKDQDLARKVEAIFKRAAFEPPLEDDVVKELRLPLNQFRKIMGTLVQQGALIRLDPKVTMHRESVEKAKTAVLQFLKLRRAITIAEAKDILKVSRKYACAVLEYLDKVQVTRRSGDAHVLK
ncbi:MAG: selenocysteine-specific translation elongation factor [Candidatus Aminicenantes bacterium]|nr:selenocysteine-specific translation elongation factor [Candidatus Aminicenantes bacterium]